MFAARSIALVASLASFVAGPACAGFESSRSTINTILGANAVNEDFQAYVGQNFLDPPANTMFGDMIGPALDSTTVANAQGPGLVVPGFRVSAPTRGVFWAGVQSVKELAFGSGPGAVTVDFLSPASAVGFDLLKVAAPDNAATVTVYASDDSTVIDTVPNLSLANTLAFFGYSHTSGIGKVSITASGGLNNVFYLDRLVFGTGQDTGGGGGVPEPGIAGLLGLGIGVLTLVRARRRQR